MNHREPPQLPVGARRALRCLSLLLLPALAPKAAHSLPRSRPAPGPAVERPGFDAPYLPVLGPPPLRFQRPAPPPDLVTHPAAGAPPVPPLTPTESTVAQANAAAAQSTAAASKPAEPPSPEPKPKETPPPAKAAPPAILPDDTRPPVRPEDFLPYFQIPGTARAPGDVRTIAPASAFNAPAPAPLPPSSATYTQTPK